MGIFNRKPLLEQLNISELKPDQKTVNQIDKKLKELETAYQQYSSKLQEIAEQKTLAEQEIEPADGNNSFDQALQKLVDFFSFKKSSKTVKQLEVEATYLQEWYTISTVNGLKEVYPQLKNALTHAKNTMEQLEQEYETANNAAELDQVLPVITGNLLELLERFKAVLKTVENGYGQSISIDSSETVKINGETIHVAFHFKGNIPVRTSLAAKEKAAAEKARSDADYRAMLRDFYSSGN